MLERQRDGIDTAKREGRYKGRVPTARRQTAEIARLKADGVRPSEIAVRLGIGRANVYRVLRGGGDRVIHSGRWDFKPVGPMSCPFDCCTDGKEVGGFSRWSDRRGSRGEYGRIPLCPIPGGPEKT